MYAVYLYKIRWNPLHHFYGALPVPYVPVWCTGRTSVYVLNAPPHCRTSQYLRTFIPLSVSLWNDLSHLEFDGMDRRILRARTIRFLFASAGRWLFVSYCLIFHFILSLVWYCGAGVFEMIGCQSLSTGLALPTFLNNVKNTYYLLDETVGCSVVFFVFRICIYSCVTNQHEFELLNIWKTLIYCAFHQNFW